MEEKRGQQILFLESFNLVNDLFNRDNPKPTRFYELEERQYRVIIVEGKEIVGRLGILHKKDLFTALESHRSPNYASQRVYLECYSNPDSAESSKITYSKR